MDYEFTSHQPADSDVARTEEWFKKAIPNPTAKNFQTQVGCMFEEFAETLAALSSKDEGTRMALHYVKEAVKALGEGLKEGEPSLIVTDRKEFLDGCLDVIVTATGSAYMDGLKVSGGMGEVNRSNFSKFDENGQPILDKNLKVMKGPNYFKPNLDPYL